MSDGAYGEFSQPEEVRLVRQLPGPVDRVWEYLTDPAKRATWFAGGPMELRAGGRAELLFRHINLSPHEQPRPEYRAAHDPGMTSVVTITHCEPPHRLSLTWETADPATSSEVTFELRPVGTRVELILTHRRVADRNDLADYSAGWHAHLDILVARLEGGTVPGIWSASARHEIEYRRRLGLAARPSS